MTSRTGGRILIDQLEIHGVRHIFCVPGESYLAALDALYDSEIELTVCRQEGGAAMMAEAAAKLTGEPGICFVTRGPGAANAAAGIHVARQDSTPMILFVGQIASTMSEREAFQEVDYRAFFSSMAKWVTQVDDPARLPELIARAFSVATSGRPGPVVIALPEDMLTRCASVPDAKRYITSQAAPMPADLAATVTALETAERPVAILGGGRWDETGWTKMQAVAEKYALPVAVSFRRQMLFPADHPNYIGDLSVAPNPELIDYIKNSDLLLLLGGRLSEMPSQGYKLLDIPNPRMKMIHVHPGPDELGRVYQPDIAINASPCAFAAALEAQSPRPVDRSGLLTGLHASYEAWNTVQPRNLDGVDLGIVVKTVLDRMPPETVIANGAGNYAVWIHRFYRNNRYGGQLAPTSGSMGYGVPAAVAAARLDPRRPVIAFAGDGCFLMHGQEFATAVQYDLPVIVIVADNTMYGTIRMHQERNYPGRVVGTSLKNPDFAEYARAFGGHGERVEHTGDFAPALERALASGRPAILHCRIDPEALSVNQTLSAMREQGQSKQQA